MDPNKRLPRRVRHAFPTVRRLRPINYNRTADGRRIAIWISTKELEHEISNFADAYLNEDFANREVVLVFLLNATTRFLCDLSRQFSSPSSVIEVPLLVEAVGPGEIVRPNLSMIRPEVLRDKDVIIMDVLVSSGATMAAAYSAVSACCPKSVTTIALLRKSAVNRAFEPDHCLFEISALADPIGYGLDLGGTGKFRGLHYVADTHVDKMPP